MNILPLFVSNVKMTISTAASEENVIKIIMFILHCPPFSIGITSMFYFIRDIEPQCLRIRDLMQYDNVLPV